MKALLMAAVLTGAGPSGAGVNIQKVAPRLPTQKVIRLGRAIDKSAVRHRVDPNVLTAIIAQESQFRSGVVRCYVIQNGKRTCDIGISQINEVWIDRLRLNPCLLRQSDEYNIDAAARILSIVRRGHEEDVTWWSRYHSGTPSHRATYEALVGRWLTN